MNVKVPEQPAKRLFNAPGALENVDAKRVEFGLRELANLRQYGRVAVAARRREPRWLFVLGHRS